MNPTDNALDRFRTGSARYTRRAVLAAGAASGLSLALAACGGKKRAAPSAPSDPAETSEPPAPAPTPTAAADPFAGIEPTSGAWERRAFAPSEALDWPHGIYFMDIATGAVEGYRVRTPLDAEAALRGYSVGNEGRLIWALDPTGKRQLALERPSNQEWAWPETVSILAARGGTAVFAANAADPGKITGEYLVTGAAFRELARYRADPGFATDVLIDADGSRFLVRSSPPNGQASIALVDSASGRELARFSPPAPQGVASTLSGLERVERSGLVTVVAGYHLASGGPGEVPPPRRYLLSLDGSGWDSPAPAPAVLTWYAPGASHHIVEVPDRVVPGGLGGGEHWPSLAVRAADGTEAYRLRSASLQYGDIIPGRRWLADGSAFFAQVERLDGAGPGWQSIEYSLVRTAGGFTGGVATPAPNGDNWFHRPLYRSPIPSPRDPALVAFGRYEVLNLATGAWTRANFANEDGPSHIDPWAAGATEIVFGSPHGGHDGRSVPALVRLNVSPPGSSGMSLRVAADGDCLNLRAEPGLGAPVLACLPGGTRLAIVDQPAIDSAGLQPPSFARTADGAWVFVATEARQRGWVSNRFLEWAD